MADTKTKVMTKGAWQCVKCGKKIKTGEDIYFDERGNPYCENCSSTTLKESRHSSIHADEIGNLGGDKPRGPHDPEEPRSKKPKFAGNSPKLGKESSVPSNKTAIWKNDDRMYVTGTHEYQINQDMYDWIAKQTGSDADSIGFFLYGVHGTYTANKPEGKKVKLFAKIPKNESVSYSNFKEFLSEGKVDAPHHGEFDTMMDLVAWIGGQSLDTSSKTDLYADGKMVIPAGMNFKKAAAKVPEIGKLVDVRQKERDAKGYEAARKRASEPPKKKKLSDSDLNKIAQKIEMTWGDVFPDGDPIDTLIPYVSKTFGIDSMDVMAALDAASKKYLGGKRFNDQMAAMWDDTIADHPQYKTERNPWR